jgi:hypothetical protein
VVSTPASVVRDLLLLTIVAAIPFGFPFLRDLGRGSRFLPFRLVPLAAGLAAVWHLRAWLDGPQWSGIPALLSLERAISPGTFVSPSPVILLLCAGLYAWGSWNTQRLAFVSPPDPSTGVSAFLGERLRGLDLERCLHEPLMRMRGWTRLLPVLALLAVLPAWDRHWATVEGRDFSLFLFWGTVCLLTALVHALAHTVHIGRVSLSLLRSLERHPIAPAFARVGQQRFPWGLSFQRARPEDLEPLAGCAARLGEMVAQLPPQSLQRVLVAGYGLPPPDTRRRTDVAAPVPGPASLAEPASSPSPARPALPSVTDQARALELGARAEDVRAIEQLRGLPLRPTEFGEERIEETEAWRVTSRVSWASARWLSRVFWNTALAEKGDDDPRARCCRQAETVLAFQVAVVVRDMLRRFVSGLSLAMGGLLLLTAMHLVYAFQGRRFWLTLDWVCLGATSAIAVVLLVALEKNGVLSRLWATDPGRINLTGGLVYRIVGYSAVPVLILFGNVFPELIGGVASWVERIRPALP